MQLPLELQAIEEETTVVGSIDGFIKKLEEGTYARWYEIEREKALQWLRETYA